ncbi:MAG: hypothetical protein ACLFTQ_00245 [Candidatus Aenigmatarchaeota archaeon]
MDHPHDVKILQEECNRLLKNGYDTVKGKIPFFDYSEKKGKQTEGEIDLAGFKFGSDEITVVEGKCIKNRHTVKSALEQLKKDRKYLHRGNGHFPDIQEEMSKINMDEVDISYVMAYGEKEDEGDIWSTELSKRLELAEEELLEASMKDLEYMLS